MGRCQHVCAAIGAYMGGCLCVAFLMFARTMKLATRITVCGTRRPGLVIGALFMWRAVLPIGTAFNATRCCFIGLRTWGIHPTPQPSGIVVLIVGAWAWFQLVVSCQRISSLRWFGSNISFASVRRGLLTLVLGIYVSDACGPTGVGLHSWRCFGVFNSRHGFRFLLQVLSLECQVFLIGILQDTGFLVQLLVAARASGITAGIVARVLFSGGSRMTVDDLASFVASAAPPPIVIVLVRRLRVGGCVFAVVGGAALAVVPELPTVMAAVYALVLALVFVCLLLTDLQTDNLRSYSGTFRLWLLFKTEESTHVSRVIQRALCTSVGGGIRWVACAAGRVMVRAAVQRRCCGTLVHD